MKIGVGLISLGGWDTADARFAALITYHGNKLAFIGCNNVGPAGALPVKTRRHRLRRFELDGTNSRITSGGALPSIATFHAQVTTQLIQSA